MNQVAMAIQLNTFRHEAMRPTRPGHCGILKSLVAGVVAALLAGCGTSSEMVADTFYRLPPADANAGPARVHTVEVRRYSASGLHNERAIAYAADADGLTLKSHGYHFWQDPPPELLRDYTIDYLRRSGIADRVAEDVGSERPDLEVSGDIHRFERVAAAEATGAHVQVEFRVSEGSTDKLILVAEYEAFVDAQDDSLESSVRALGAATRDVHEALVADLEELLDAAQ